jgi:ABC-type polysaccharide/polyol phosphate transport system ATPase subunit
MLQEKARADGPSDLGSAKSAVSIQAVSKTFRLPHQQYHTLKERALHPFRARTFERLSALEDVSVEIAPGEFFGIVGRNGSGKSTLLKCLAGIYGIDKGQIDVQGRLSPFIELGVGFNPDLTARDNVIINAIMLGLSRKEARERFPDVIAFAELEEFVDLKLKNYSSGMHVRLAFATAVQVDADVLLIDEVLAVGDAAFQQKCFDEFDRLRQAGRTMLLVTHDMGAVERYCDRAMLLDHGHVVAIDDPTSIARQYNQLNFPPIVAERGSGADEEAAGRGAVAQVAGAWFESPAGEVIVSAQRGEPCVVRIDTQFLATVDDPIFAIRLQNDAGHFVFAANTEAAHAATGHFEAGSTARVRMPFENWLAPGHYRLIVTVARAGHGADVFASHMSNSIIVLADRSGGGMTDLPHTFEIDRER